jgi:hypothetical protein
MEDLNKDCLRLIFGNLNTKTLYNIQRVSKLFLKISEDCLGISRQKTIIDTLNDEINALENQLNEKKSELYDAYLTTVAKKTKSSRWGKSQMIGYINKFNAVYGNIEGTIDPQKALRNVKNIRLQTTYYHIAPDCTNKNIFVSTCNCPIYEVKLTFDFFIGGERERSNPFSSSYLANRPEPFDGFFDNLCLRNFDNDNLVTRGWNMGHVIEHILKRVIEIEIKIRKQVKTSINFTLSQINSNSEGEGEGEGEGEVFFDRERNAAWIRIPNEIVEQMVNNVQGEINEADGDEL